MTTPEKPKAQHGGSRLNAGRHKRVGDFPPATSWLPTSQSQVDAWRTLGGAAWLRGVLEEEILKDKQSGSLNEEGS